MTTMLMCVQICKYCQ